MMEIYIFIRSFWEGGKLYNHSCFILTACLWCSRELFSNLISLQFFILKYYSFKHKNFCFNSYQPLSLTFLSIFSKKYISAQNCFCEKTNYSWMRFMLFARMFRIAQKWSEQSWISELSKDEQSLSVLLQIEQKKWKTFLQNYARSWWEPKEIEMSMFCWKKSCLMISMNFYDFYEFYEALLFLASSLLFCYFFACFLVFERRNASQYFYNIRKF